jgi:hypothetical protein
MSKRGICWLLLLMATPAPAIETATLTLAHLKSQGWQLQGIKISVITPAQHTPQLQLTIQQLSLPEPFTDLKLLNVRCAKFSWQKRQIDCVQGTAQLHSKKFDSPTLQFSFAITPTQSQFHIQHLKLLKGQIDIQGSAQQGKWQLSLNGVNCGLSLLHELLFPQLKLSSGLVDISAKATGNWQGAQHLTTRLQAKDLSLQTADGKKAGEHLALITNLHAAKVKQQWLWQTENFFNSGSLYVEPFYVENKSTVISLSGRGYADLAQQTLEIDRLKFIHPTIATINAYATVQYAPVVVVTQGKVYAQVSDLAAASQVYVAPFIATTALEGLALSGELEAKTSIQQSTLTDGYLIANHLDIIDQKQRFALMGGAMTFNWANQDHFSKNSILAWKELKLYSLSLGQNYFPLLLKEQKIHLPKPFIIPLLGGDIRVEKFDWQAIKDKSPQVHFAGSIHQVSLEKLTQALKVQPISGYLSGQIPSVNVAESKLSLDGGLQINVFDGSIAIHKLAISGFMTDFTQFYSDIVIDNLDLEQLTQKFSFGSMQGRLSGYITDLYLENWQPITFNAWLGTMDDNSTHQISQKAVQNIATIGGGGAVDAVSRAILSIFDNFNYEKIGLGCYLQKGICQLTGVEAADYGYYIIKGGGLPRIDVMGYNTRIDWKVLQERLQRIGKTDKAVIE